jgi:hypothetical protein
VNTRQGVRTRHLCFGIAALSMCSLGCSDSASSTLVETDSEMLQLKDDSEDALDRRADSDLNVRKRQAVTPSVACVEPEDGRTLRAYFSYTNPNGETVTRKVGPKNGFSPAPRDRGQPHRFAAGVHDRAFSVRFRRDDSLTWQLDGLSATATAGSAPCTGGTAGSAPDSGTGGVGGGAAGGAGDAGSGDCLDRLGSGTGDAITVQGEAGALGLVDYTIWGYSAGVAAPDGLQRFTNSVYGQHGTPAGISDTGLWAWTNMPMAEVGTIYMTPAATVNFRIFFDNYNQQVECSGDHSGSFRFVSFNSDGVFAAGTYEFDCPDSSIHVTGCFRYVN